MPRQLQASRRAAGALASTSSTSFSTASSIGKRYRGEGRADAVAVPKLSLPSLWGGEYQCFRARLRIEACLGPLGPSGALWAPVLDFRGALCFYALGALVPPSLHGTRRHTDLRIKSPPATARCLPFVINVHLCTVNARGLKRFLVPEFKIKQT